MRGTTFNHVNTRSFANRSPGCSSASRSCISSSRTRPRLPSSYFALSVDDFEAVYVKAKALGILDDESWSSHIYELPDGSVQLYLRDPAGNLVEVDWPDVTTLDRSVVTDLRKLADDVPQNGDAARATLFPAG